MLRSDKNSHQYTPFVLQLLDHIDTLRNQNISLRAVARLNILRHAICEFDENFHADFNNRDEQHAQLFLDNALLYDNLTSEPYLSNFAPLVRTIAAELIVYERLANDFLSALSRHLSLEEFCIELLQSNLSRPQHTERQGYSLFVGPTWADDEEMPELYADFNRSQSPLIAGVSDNSDSEETIDDRKSSDSTVTSSYSHSDSSQESSPALRFFASPSKFRKLPLYITGSDSETEDHTLSSPSSSGSDDYVYFTNLSSSR